jgi:hypothetical protein
MFLEVEINLFLYIWLAYLFTVETDVPLEEWIL